MTKERMMLLLSPLFLAAMIAVVNAGGNSPIQEGKANPKVSFFDEDFDENFDKDPFFSSHLNAIEEFKKIQEKMDRPMKAQFLQLQKSPFHPPATTNLMSEKWRNISVKETSNKLIYTIPKPQGNNSKVNVTLKDRLLLIDILITEEKKKTIAKAQRFQYSQSSYSQSIQLPSAYDPGSMDVTTKEADVIVTFNKHWRKSVKLSKNIA